jgi:hypothetical protein
LKSPLLRLLLVIAFAALLVLGIKSGEIGEILFKGSIL